MNSIIFSGVLAVLVFLAAEEARGESTSVVISSNTQSFSKDNNGVKENYLVETTVEKKADGTCVKNVKETWNGKTTVNSATIDCSEVKDQTSAIEQETSAELDKTSSILDEDFANFDSMFDSL